MSTIKISEGTRRELNSFKEYMRKQEYAVSSVLGYCTYLSRFLRQAGVQQTEALTASINAFLKAEKEGCPQTFKDCRAALRLYYRMVTGCHLKGGIEENMSPAITDLLQGFLDYSLNIKHIEKTTAYAETSHVRKFLEYVTGYNPLNCTEGLTAEDIRRYVVNRLNGLSDSSKGCHITSIRNFFRCQDFYGHKTHPSIFQLPLSPAVWKKSAFPTTIDVNVFNSLHTVPDKNTSVGKRDRSIILCFTELALRCSEVAALTLDDFNWHGGYVTIRNTKNKSDRILPLPEKMGDAIVEYLVNGRPETSSRILFVRFSHKRGEPMGRGQIRNVIRWNSAKAGLDDKACGTHILRRTAATLLYNSGNSLKLTADILGHKSLDSTVHYTKADLTGLLSVASSWPGGECNA